MAINAVFERAQLEQRFNVEGLGRLDLALDADGPGARGKAAGVLGGIGLLQAELVEVVVVGYVFIGGERFAGGGERALDCFELGSGLRGDAGREYFG